MSEIKTVSMIEISKILNEKGIKNYYEMTGGNCGTILIGERNADGFFEFAVGPSSYNLGNAYFGEICWGIDDEGQAEPFYFKGDESAFTPQQVAEQIAQDYANSKKVNA